LLRRRKRRGIAHTVCHNDIVARAATGYAARCTEAPVTFPTFNRPAWMSPTVVGVLCGTIAALSWAVGFVAARHGVQIGLKPQDLAFHRFFWIGLLLIPAIWRAGLSDLGGVGWARGFVIFMLAGPMQGFLSAAGFTLAPLGHGGVIQPGTAALVGLILATLILHEPLRLRRILGASAILAGLILLGAEAVTTIGTHGLGGDLLFLSAGIFWATFGTLLRLWNLRAQRAAIAITALSLIVYAPLHAVVFGFDSMIAAGLGENVLQIVIQGVFAGPLAVHLFARAVALLGAGRAAAFPAMVPPATLLIGVLALGEIPTMIQLAGLAVVVVGFRLALQQNKQIRPSA
jgi:drug/metabolite transporter (DMT)-like permease